MAKLFKLITSVPESHADQVRQALGDAGAGKYGNYSHCTFSIKGEGRFIPTKGANPTIGNVGEQSKVPEIKIETHVTEDILTQVITALRQAHPYEEPVIDIYELISAPK